MRRVLPLGTANLNCQLFWTESVVTFSPQSDTYWGYDFTTSIAYTKHQRKNYFFLFAHRWQRNTLTSIRLRHSLFPEKEAKIHSTSPVHSMPTSLTQITLSSPSVHLAVRAASPSQPACRKLSSRERGQPPTGREFQNTNTAATPGAIWWRVKKRHLQCSTIWKYVLSNI